MGGVAHWLAGLARKRWMPIRIELKPIKGFRCFYEQGKLPSLRSILVSYRNCFERDKQTWM